MRLVLYHEELKLIFVPGDHLVEGLVIWHLIFLLASNRGQVSERV